MMDFLTWVVRIIGWVFVSGVWAAIAVSIWVLLAPLPPHMVQRENEGEEDE